MRAPWLHERDLLSGIRDQTEMSLREQIGICIWSAADATYEYNHRVHIFTRETGLVCLPTQLERILQLYLGW
jgi:hypothetical protein